MSDEIISNTSHQPNDLTSLEKFLTDFIGALASDALTADGNLLSYLAKPEKERSGDEANLVDFKITRCLITLLGYAQREVTYNQQKKNLRADFVVQIDEYPDRACFIVEDKSTTHIRLASYRAQLQGYMGQYKAPRGLLCNGQSILAYDQTEGSVQTPVLEISVVDVVRLWCGEHIAAQGKVGIAALDIAGMVPVLAAFWRRFRRDSFASLTKLIDDLTLQSEKGNNAPHRTDGKTWIPSLCRLPIIPVDENNASMLTDSLKGLIAEIEDDANAQLSVVERDYAEYHEFASRLPNESTTLTQREDGLVADALGLMPREGLHNPRRNAS